MITFKNLSKKDPYKLFKFFYDQSIQNNQLEPQAIAISSYNKSLSEVQCRFVNLKYILGDEWIFFSNYNSPKSISFKNHDQISATFYWNTIKVQVRVMAKIKKTDKNISDEHFRNRNWEKNALAISSEQSNNISTYEEVYEKYNKVLNGKLTTNRPKYWGGFSFFPYSFEFWEGHNARVNKRTFFSKKKDTWIKKNLEP